MAAHSRYSVDGDEPDILPNKQDITDSSTLADTEAVLLVDSYKHFFDLLEEKRIRITPSLFFEIIFNGLKK